MPDEMNYINVLVAVLCGVISAVCFFVTAAQGSGVFAALFVMMLLQSARDLANEIGE